ncbi:LysR family transcriptional regulator [Asaia krungthepensis]|nr:LysR family transcriptional regulator [Asaia krungthepensis]
MMDTLIFRLKFRQLLLLRQISIEPSLNRAARSLNLSQPTASKLLQDMETDLEAQLFERHAHGLTPTGAGLVAIRHAEQILADLGRLRHDLQAVKRGLSGTVRIGAIGAALHDLVTPVLSDLAQSHPEINVTLQVTTSDDLMEMLQAGRIDLALGRPVEGVSPGLLMVEEMAPEPLHVVAGAQNPLLQGQTFTLETLSALRWIVPVRPSPMRKAVEAIFTMARLPLPEHPIEVSSILATIDLLAQSDMVSALPGSVCALFAGSGMVRILPVSLPDVIGPYFLMRMRERNMTPAVAHLARQLRERAIGLSDSAIQEV